MGERGDPGVRAAALAAMIAIRLAGRAVKITTARGQEWQAGNLLLSQKIVAMLLAAGFLGLDGDDVVLKGNPSDLA